MAGTETFSINVNGTRQRVDGEPGQPLIFALRNALGLTGTKLGCGLEQCGACAVIVDGRVEFSCTFALEDAAGKDIVTVEGLAREDGPSDVQQAFIDTGAAQCGYCIPGLVIAVTALLAAKPKPTTPEITEALSPHLCRCGTHPRILKAVRHLIDGRYDHAAKS